MISFEELKLYKETNGDFCDLNEMGKQAKVKKSMLNKKKNRLSPFSSKNSVRYFRFSICFCSESQKRTRVTT